MNYTISMTDILLAVSVGCNLWFLFLLLYERIMDTRIVRFFKGIVGLWRSLDGNEAKRIAAHEEVPAEKADIIGIVGYFTIPTVAGWIIQAGGGIGSYNKNIGTAGALAGSLAGATAGNVAGRTGRFIKKQAGRLLKRK